MSKKNHNNHAKEADELITKIKSLEFVINAEIKSINTINSKTAESTLHYNKAGWYVANVACCGRSYKVLIEVDKNKPDPKYEKKLKKAF